MSVEGKRVLITGGSSFIGSAIAKRFVDEGASVVISYHRNAPKAPFCKALPVDLTDHRAIESFYQEVMKALGGIDILINCVGGYDTRSFLETPVETFREILQVGVSGAFHMIQLVAKGMIEKGVPGSIINISSISGERAYPNRVAHCTAKAALNMLTKTAALELGPYGIRVNAIAPGSTPYMNTFTSSNSIPLRKEARGSDHASAALFLASNQAGHITGHILTVDGGQLLPQAEFGSEVHYE